MEKKKKIKVCEFAYNRVEIVGMTGDVTFCCPSYTDFYSLGNLNEQTFDEIWNGEKARKIRQSMIDGSFKYCHTDLCSCDGYPIINVSKDISTIAPYPENIEIAVSTICNCLCTMCRKPDTKVMEAEREHDFYEKMRVKYLPILKHAKILSLNNYGEVFFDKNCKKLIKYAIAINKNLKVDILTNGIFADIEHFEDYGILDKTRKVSVSIHAKTKETYDSIVKNGNFNRVYKNIQWLAKEKQNGRFEEVVINFVVQQKNYKEMIDFAKWAKKLKINCCFWEVRLDIDNQEIWDKNISPEYKKQKYFKTKNPKHDISEYYKAAIHLPQHPEHKELVKIVQNPIFKEPFCNINDLLNCLNK